MGIFRWIKGVYERMFKKDAKKVFKTDVILSDKMEQFMNLWASIIDGCPPWLDKEDDIGTINFAKFLTSNIAKKICLDIDINVTGGARAAYLQKIVDKLKKVLRDKVEDAVGSAGIMFKPNGSMNVNNCIDYILAKDFLVTETNANGDILGAIFFDYVTKTYAMGKRHYTRMEWHRFENGLYVISNRAFVSDKESALGTECNLGVVEAWEDILPEQYIVNLEKPLFAYFKMPYNNTIDNRSPLGVPVFHNAIKELRNLDIAWSRKETEIEDSKHISYVDISTIRYAKQNKVKLPRFMKGIDMSNNQNSVNEHVATILTDARIKDINSILSMISTKCGFSQGQFTLDGKTGMITATQVEADDRETIETIKDMRDALKDCIKDLLYALNAYADLYNLAPVGTYELSCAFGDLTYNWEEDRARHWQYVQQNKYPLYRYYMEFEGMSEDEAKAVVAEAQKENEKKRGLFEEE